MNAVTPRDIAISRIGTLPEKSAALISQDNLKEIFDHLGKLMEIGLDIQSLDDDAYQRIEQETGIDLDSVFDLASSVAIELGAAREAAYLLDPGRHETEQRQIVARNEEEIGNGKLN
ncbi:TPA: hypothetical protein ACRNCK_005308 [Pseudomonas aeruginosa]|uniref:hypothetical protein n=1 Tax=Pseudomonas aeruginosa TaxID=287 RepID=UPI001573F0A5|nr:hypothetical protein [Pseudomonas aeruginosa]NTT93906.1 hypothetical protein [Pseudomonas aeruginosa]HCF3158034.1 hypothetical protein [Pseudomonas aeruginosa]HDR2972468.1 hypothetical protein [Pseudomonas aeruginosa]